MTARSPDRPLVLVGAGMHGRVVRDLCREAGIIVAGFLDDWAESGSDVDDVPVLGSSKLIGDAAFVDHHCFIVTIGNNLARQAFAARIESSGGELVTVFHPNCVISPTARIGDGTVLIGGNMVFSRAAIGNNVLIDPDATIGAQSAVGDCAYISPGVHLGAATRIGAYAFVGLGAVVLPEVAIGAKAIVGAGAVVTRDVPDEVLAVGNPAVVKGKAILDKMSPYPARGHR